MTQAATILFLSVAVAATSGAADNGSKKSPDSKTKYCMQVEPSTGSRIITTECKTKAEWQALGVDIDQAAGK
jgi:hypothetical protein